MTAEEDGHVGALLLYVPCHMMPGLDKILEIAALFLLLLWWEVVFFLLPLIRR